MNFTIVLRKSKSSNANVAGKSKAYVRCFEGKKIDFRSTINVEIYAEYWDSKNLGYKVDTPVDLVSPIERLTVNSYIKKVLRMVRMKYRPGADAKWLKEAVKQCELRTEDFAPVPEDNKIEAQPVEPGADNPYLRPKCYSANHKNKNEIELSYEAKVAQAANRESVDTTDLYLLDCFEQYLEEAEFNDWHRQAQTSIMHRLQRYEKWIGFFNDIPDFKLMMEECNKDQVEDFASYMEHEAEYKEAHPEFFAQFHMRNPKWIRPVSRNSVVVGIKRLNMFLNWAVKNELLHDLSFRNVTCDQQIYGTPYYLTIEERDKIAALDLSDSPRLENHRDKFIFQCHVGCRNNDLEQFTWDHINGDFLEYIPHKNLLAGRTQLVRCPLDETAKDILLNIDPDQHFLFNVYHRDFYRQDIKELIKRAGIDRMVTVYNPLTRKSEPKKLSDVAASHLARRTFIGNLYKQVQDPALIASLTGHTENSTSFNRYRTIDDDIKREVLKYLE